MSKLKIALIGCGIAAALSSAAHGFDARLGNGSTWVTIDPAITGSQTRQPLAPSPSLPLSRYGNGHN